MAQATGGTHPIIGLNQTFGGLFWDVLDYSGSASYVQGGDSISPPSFGFNNTIWALSGSMDQLNVFEVVGRPLNSGRTQWQLVWKALITGTYGGQSQTAGQEAAAGTNLTGYTVRLAAIGQ
jgi:hypothetical protein